MKRKLAISFLFVFAMAIASPVLANTLPTEPQKKETTDKKECDKTEKKECDKAADKKACCDKKEKAPKK